MLAATTSKAHVQGVGDRVIDQELNGVFAQNRGISWVQWCREECRGVHERGETYRVTQCNLARLLVLRRVVIRLLLGLSGLHLDRLLLDDVLLDAAHVLGDRVVVPRKGDEPEATVTPVELIRQQSNVFQRPESLEIRLQVVLGQVLRDPTHEDLFGVQFLLAHTVIATVFGLVLQRKVGLLVRRLEDERLAVDDEASVEVDRAVGPVGGLEGHEPEPPGLLGVGVHHDPEKSSISHQKTF